MAASRDPAEVCIVGVTKYVGPELALQLAQAGCRILGENRPQSLWSKHEYFQAHAAEDTQWHMIGHLQRNKLRRTLPLLDCLHSLDSLRLAEAISHEATAVARVLPVLVEVNFTQDSSKTGLPPSALPAFVEQVRQLPGLRIEGLMAMASQDGSEAQTRREFEQVRQARDELQQAYSGELTLSQLSMGMSGDFRQAVAAGATLVRIGSSLWEGVLAAA
ncbi:MAG: YggS family pyridoxal phosphate-dependent enzyme [Planctomycetales bacterium]|nr:YggS family pyridoxal phosphate-dependent enzyme [Planctomycetales bacterium]